MATPEITEERRVRIANADEELLASLGYKQEFKRTFTSFEVFGVAFSIISLVPSIASSLVYAMPNGGPVSMIWGWLAASIFILFVGLAMAELASAAPTSGGLYFWTWSFSSPKYKKILSWLVGYANTIGTIAGIASIDWGCAVQVMAAATIGSGGKFVGTTGQTYAVYLAILFTHAVVCSLATSLLARLQNVYVILNLVLFLAILIALPIATPTQFKNSANYALGSFTNLSGYPNGFAFFLSWLAPVWTIGSYDSSVHISEEASNASVAVPWAIVGAIAISGILGTALNIAIAFCMGTDIDAILNSSIGQPLAAIFFNSFGERATLGIWSAVVITQWGMGSSIVLSTSRQVFAFSRDGAMPFSSILYRMNEHTGTPVNTVWFSVFIAALLGLLAFAGEVAIMAVFSIAVIGLYIAYIIPIGARFIFKQHSFKPGPFTLGVFGLPVATIAVAFMSFITVVLLFPSRPIPEVSEMNYAVVVMGGVMVGSVVWYYFPKYGGIHWFEGPVSTIEVADGASSAHTRAASTMSFEKGREKNDVRVYEREVPNESV
ncbi:GABA-specific permease OS=Saccharomyces cerevisiae (strain ATCC 204508 / S288c) GN=UGA4 PE=1 SV=1 [Rhizoctonia solani AG-1 IB]|uniref:GABA-specific permease n=1 Tax=Thanatephorus cucumeris (strain AG1-IB / isolate 7/3/14) TaxID=1108050 RepID=A0A0B7FAW2_THACB|nr:GABA-specific permease OS=Saccharomyces cerevisiae (strain ATCC 204508 / S288c) GN=UGA4 PE=1 SV=1 [Rhizoctonia solani AG-1 IB]